VKIRDLEESRRRWKERALAAEQALSEANSPPEGKKQAGSAPDQQADEASLVEERKYRENRDRPRFSAIFGSVLCCYCL
jgi:hypothetical protein